ncbi:AAA family ATPase [Mycoplasma crocodyli]|uniref:Putative DNA helicase n=1 Tax=Mycoplasma crocodyli (strain ATCC 51981 / MP145) TaxID=512564 RepID=D5E5Y4_MYCCM|nr:AAA family ATPase [Mycoplasma crocodyli]ADE19595.1 putative DNA helicase [Mycoplasma crocodyli MP145]
MINKNLSFELLKNKDDVNNIDFVEETINNFKKYDVINYLLKKHNVSDQEIKENFANFLEMYRNNHLLSNQVKHLFFERDFNNKLVFKEVFGSNEAAEKEKIKPFLWLNELWNINFKASIDDFTDKKTKRKMIEYIDAIYLPFLREKQYIPNIKGIYLSGEPYCGKTYMFHAMAKEAAILSKSVAVIEIENLYKHLIGEISKKQNQNINSIENRLKNVDILFFDRFGSEKQSEWFTLNFILKIIDERFKSNKITFFASDITMKQLFEKYSKTFPNEISKTKRLLIGIKKLCEKEIIIEGEKNAKWN